MNGEELIEAAKALQPWTASVDTAISQLASISPELVIAFRAVDRPVFGSGSDFYYLPSAQALDWGIDDPFFHGEVGPVFALGHLYYCLHDDLLDEGSLSYEHAVLMDAAINLYLSGLSSISTSALLEHFALSKVYSSAILRDHAQWSQYLSSDAALRAGEKSAPVLAALWVVAERTGHLDECPAMYESSMWMTNAIQLMDDLEDLPSDLDSAAMTFPKALALRDLPSEDPIRVRTALEPHTIRLAEHCLDRARRAIENSNASVIAHMINRLSDVLASRKEHLTVLRQTQDTRE